MLSRLPHTHTMPTPTLSCHLLRSAVAAAAALALLVSGCATSGDPKPSSPQQRADATPSQADLWAKLGYRLDWRGFPTMLPGEHVNTLEIFGDVLAIQESAGVVSIIETRSGQTRWSDQVAGRLTKFVGINRDNNNLLISSESEVYFYDIATGNLKTKQHLAQVVNTRPVKVNDMLIYGCANGQILGHLTLNGFRAWGSGLTGSIETDPLLVSATSGHVALCSTTGQLVIFDGQTGVSQGRNKVFGDSGADMACSDTTLFLASADQSLYAFNSATCQQIWRKRTEHPLKNAPTYHEGRVYCDMGPTDDKGMGGLSCFEPVSGKLVWSNPKLSGTIVAARAKRLLCWDGRTCSTIDPATGTVNESATLDNISIIKPDTFADGHLYAISPNGIVTKLSPK